MDGLALDRALEAEDSGSEIDLGWGEVDNDSEFELELAAAAEDMKADAQPDAQPETLATSLHEQQDKNEPVVRLEETNAIPEDISLGQESPIEESEPQPEITAESTAKSADSEDEEIELGWGSDDNLDTEPLDDSFAEQEPVEVAADPVLPQSEVENDIPEEPLKEGEIVDAEIHPEEADSQSRIELASDEKLDFPEPEELEKPEETLVASQPESEEPKSTGHVADTKLASEVDLSGLSDQLDELELLEQELAEEVSEERTQAVLEVEPELKLELGQEQTPSEPIEAAPAILTQQSVLEDEHVSCQAEVQVECPEDVPIPGEAIISEEVEVPEEAEVPEEVEIPEEVDVPEPEVTESEEANALEQSLESEPEAVETPTISEHSDTLEETEPVEHANEATARKIVEGSVGYTEAEALSESLSEAQPEASTREVEPEVEPKTISLEASESVPETASASSANAFHEVILSLKAQLENAEAERDDIQDQYDELLEKVTQIKSTLGARFKADAAELSRLRSELEQSQEANNQALNEISELKVSLKAAEMTAAAADKGAESADRQVTNALERAANAENALAMLQYELEEERSVHSSEKQLLELQAQEAQSLGESLAAELEIREKLQTALDAANLEAAKARQLAEQTQIETTAQLEGAQRRHESELEAIKASCEAQIQSLKAAYEADAAEKKELETRIKNSEQLEQQVREKTLQVGKLRHEAVILNEHLTNALRLIKKEAEGPTVDKELISNLIVQFATKDRADTKKFEVLQLIANILSWNEERMIETGLLRDPSAVAASGTGEPASGFFGRFTEFLDREARKKTGK